MNYYIVEQDGSVSVFHNKELYSLNLKRRIDSNSEIKLLVKNDAALLSEYKNMSSCKCYYTESNFKIFEQILGVYLLDEDEYDKWKGKNKNEKNN